MKIRCPRTKVCLFFRDAASRRVLLSVIGQLAETQPEILVTSLLHCLLNSGVISRSGVPGYSFHIYSVFLGFQQYSCKTSSDFGCALASAGSICRKSSGSAAFIGLSWTCLLTARVFSDPEKREGALWKKMVSLCLSLSI